MRPFTTSRMITVRLPPPDLPGGIKGSTSSHSSSVRSLGYRNLLRSYRPRFLLVHIGDLSSNQATTLESQMIHMIQELFGQTLRYSEQARTLSIKKRFNSPAIAKAPNPRCVGVILVTDARSATVDLVIGSGSIRGALRSTCVSAAREARAIGRRAPACRKWRRSRLRPGRRLRSEDRF